MGQNNINRRRSTLLISHRHADKAIADVLKNALHSWCNGQIQVFQSSDIRENVSKVGQELTDTQKKALSETNIVLLIYTVSDDDWLCCMWECGLATNTRGQRTRIIVFNGAHDIPVTLRDQVQVALDEESIKKFVHDFHKDPTFFPGRDEAFAPEMDEKSIEARSCDIFNKLRGVCIK